MTHAHGRGTLLCCLAALLSAAACSKPPSDRKKTSSSLQANIGENKRAAPADDSGKSGLNFTLEPGPGSPDGKDRPPYDPGKPLDEAETRSLLARLPAEKPLDLKKDFALREKSLPPPRAGLVVQDAWPPPAKPLPPDAGDPGKLEVVRTSPPEDVYIAPNISVTFSQPMVAVTSHADTIAAGIPVQIQPEVKGKWRWLGTRTLVFESELERLPKSTRYTVTVKSGIASAVGKKLGKDVSWSFSTPTVQVETFYPQGGPQKLNPVFFVRMDQRIDPAAILAMTEMQSNASVNVPLKMATDADIERDPAVTEMVRTARREYEGRWLVFVPMQALTPGTTYTVRLGPGLPSAEGPEKTREPAIFSLRTYDPLAVEGQNCESSEYACRPPGAMYLRFNNPLDEEKFDEKWVKVSPAIPGMRVIVRDHMLFVTGKIQGRRSYIVRVSGDLADTYGQTLGADAERTFHFREAYPQLMHNYKRLTVADPSAPPEVRFTSVNLPRLTVRVYQVNPADFRSYLRYAERHQWDDTVPAPGKLVHEKTLKLDTQADAPVESIVDLKPYLSGGKHGHLMVAISETPMPKERYQWHTFTTWVTFTDLAVDAHMDHRNLHALVTRLSDGRAVEGARVQILGTDVSARSGADGLAKLEMPPSAPENGAGLLVAKLGNDSAFLPREEYPYGEYMSGYVASGGPGASHRFFTFDDRRLYKPRESVSLKGYLRYVDMGPAAGLNLPESWVKEVSWTAFDPRNNKIAEGRAPLNALGGFHFTFAIPDNANLGMARVQLSAADATGRHSFQIAEFRKPEFEVDIATPPGPFVIGDRTDLTLSASYFSGGGLPGADVHWNVDAVASSYAPPNWLEWSFGDQAMRWWFFEDEDEGGRGKPAKVGKQAPRTLAGSTDSRGRHAVRLTFLEARPSVPYAVTAQATVTDVNRQTWTASASLLVHPSSLYVGLRTPRTFVPAGQPMRVEAVVTDIDGKRIAGIPVQVRAVRDRWEYQRGKLRRIEGNARTCAITSAADAPAACDLNLEEGGSYTITAEIADAAGRRNLTRITRYVEGGELPIVRDVERERVNLVADKTEYQPGETARVFVQAPFSPAEGIWFLRHAGMDTPHRFTMSGPTTVLEIPLTEAHMPETEVQVEITGTAARVDDAGRPVPSAPRRPAYAGGNLSLPVSTARRALSVQLTPEAGQLSPGQGTNIQISVRDAQGRPAADAEIAIVAVDEAVLALSGYRIPDPLSAFHPSRAGGTYHRWLRQHVQLADPLKLDVSSSVDAIQAAGPTMVKSAEAIPEGVGAMPPAPGGAKREAIADMEDSREERAKAGPKAKDGKNAAPAPLAVRSDFSALALFAPEVRTDAAGRAQVRLKLPDNLTRYRLMAVAVAGPRFYGRGESTVTARLPLQVRPSPPRFLNFGDRFELSLVVLNQTEQKQEVRVAVRGQNIIWKETQGKKVRVPAKDRREVRFAAAADSPGMAHVDAIAAAADVADAASFELPVWTPATTEGFATYGTIDSGAIVQPVSAPTNVVPNFGSLDVQTSSTQLQALTDAVLYLYAYPYECAEQLSSRILSVAALRDVLSAFQTAGLPDDERIRAAMERDLQKLGSMQNGDGGFPFWIRGQESWPFLTVHVTHALLRAQEKGYPVNANMLRRALAYLAAIENHIPAEYPEWVKRSIVAYSLYVRNLGRDADVAKAAQLLPHFVSGKEPDLESVGWLYPVFVAGKKQETLQAIRKLLLSRVSETAGAANFVTYASDGAHLILHSDRRVDALLLSGLMLDQPQSDLIPKVVAGLLAHRKQGRWANTQESVWVLLALDQYFQTYEKTTPNFVSRIWLGEDFAGEHRFAGRTTERHVVAIPMQALGKRGTRKDLLLAKDGAGRLYYRIGLTYALSDLRPPPADHGFTVSRRYEGLEKSEDVRRDADGTWRVRAGARVKVTLTMLVPSRRYHVALVDPLPAGFEPENTALRGAPPSAGASGDSDAGPMDHKPGRGHAMHRRWRWWWGVWYEHHNIRDERVEAFASLLDAGVHTFVYTARATTPGEFVVPPLKAEEMYAPETFGRSAGDRVVVEP